MDDVILSALICACLYFAERQGFVKKRNHSQQLGAVETYMLPIMSSGLCNKEISLELGLTEVSA